MAAHGFDSVFPRGHLGRAFGIILAFADALSVVTLVGYTAQQLGDP